MKTYKLSEWTEISRNRLWQFPEKSWLKQSIPNHEIPAVSSELRHEFGERLRIVFIIQRSRCLQVHALNEWSSDLCKYRKDIYEKFFWCFRPLQCSQSIWLLLKNLLQNYLHLSRKTLGSQEGIIRNSMTRGWGSSPITFRQQLHRNLKASSCWWEKLPTSQHQ